MRFAYIDSQGNEVTIPSVDALALRIELGAINEDTELFDAQANVWGPAHTHEIFHTLSRDAEDDGFVPPPVAPPPAASEPAEAAPVADEIAAPPAEAEVVPESAPPAEEEAVPSFDMADGLQFDDEDPPQDESVVDGGADATFAASAFDLAPAGGDAPDEPTQEDAGAPADMSFGDMGLDLASPPAAEAEAEESEESFDFGDFSGGFEFDEDDGEDEDEDQGPEGAVLDLDEPAAEEGGIGLASPMDFAGGGAMGGGLELETPMSEFTAEDPPAWMEQDAGDSDEDTLVFDAPAASAGPTSSGPGEDESGEDDGPPMERPAAPTRSRPSPPRRPKKKLPVGMILAVAGIAIVGGGGFFAWQALGSGGGSDADDEEGGLPAVVIPEIPAELLPQMRDLADAALANMLDDLRGRSEDLDIPVQPRDEWLGGEYLGTASQFEDIEQFWLGIERFVDEVRSTDTDLFHAKYAEQVQAAELDEAVGDVLAERADSGFVAARDGRFEAYALMDDLVNAALDLHQFLLDNEIDIAYEPASAGMTRDPVLEAVPATEALGDEMWDLVNGITGALQDLGTLDRVTRERLFAVLFDRIRIAGIQ
jgi:hypothetical protein